MQDAVILCLAFVLGFVIESQDKGYTCPKYCETDHVHRINKIYWNKVQSDVNSAMAKPEVITYDENAHKQAIKDILEEEGKYMSDKFKDPMEAEEGSMIDNIFNTVQKMAFQDTASKAMQAKRNTVPGDRGLIQDAVAGKLPEGVRVNTGTSPGEYEYLGELSYLDANHPLAGEPIWLTAQDWTKSFGYGGSVPPILKLNKEDLKTYDAITQAVVNDKWGSTGNIVDFAKTYVGEKVKKHYIDRLSEKTGNGIPTLEAISYAEFTPEQAARGTQRRTEAYGSGSTAFGPHQLLYSTFFSDNITKQVKNAESLEAREAALKLRDEAFNDEAKRLGLSAEQQNFIMDKLVPIWRMYFEYPAGMIAKFEPGSSRN